MKDIITQVHELCNLESEEAKLTDWEVDFIESIAKQLTAQKTLSQKQIAIVSRIWDDVFIHGKRKPRQS